MEPITTQVTGPLIVQIATVVTPVILIVGLAFACNQWLSGRNARMADIVLTLLAQWESEPLRRGRRALALHSGEDVLKRLQTADLTHLGPQALEQSEMDLGDELSFFDLVSVANFFDGLGILLQQGYLKVEVAYRLFHAAEEHYYSLYKLAVEHQQYEDFCEGFRSLHRYFAEEKNKQSSGRKKKRPI